MKFFNLSSHDEANKSAVVQIMDQIGYDWWTDEGTEAKTFMAAVRELGDLDEVFLEINSPGGNVHEGVSIANFIKQHPAKWKAKVVGNAASISSVIACACDEVEMGVGTNMLVHKPSSLLFGMVNADEARELAENLDTIESSISEFYMSRITAKGKSAEELNDLMREDRYMTASEAIEWGFADTQIAELEAVACADTRKLAYSNFFTNKINEQAAEMEKLRAERDQLKQENARISEPELVAQAKVVSDFAEAGLSNVLEHFVTSSFTSEELTSKVGALCSLKEVCEARNLSFANLAEKISEPADLLATAITDFEASLDDEIEGHHKGQPESLAKTPSYDRAYAQFNVT